MAMKRRIRPVHHTLNVTMFHWIEVKVIHMCLVVAIIANLMLPKTSLPKRRFTMFVLRARHQLRLFETMRALASYHTLNQIPTQRKVRISGGQRPQGVQVVGQ